MTHFTESILEEAALSWLAELGYAVKNSPVFAPGELFSERESYQQVLLRQRLREALARLNPTLPAEAMTSKNSPPIVPPSKSNVLSSAVYPAGIKLPVIKDSTR